MKCLNCGTEHTTKFCPECGAPAPEMQTQQPKLVQPALYGAAQVTNLAENKKSKKKSLHLLFMGRCSQPIGNIPAGEPVILTIGSSSDALDVCWNKTHISLPFVRIQSFILSSESQMRDSGNVIGRAILGGALLGSTGAIVGGMSAKNKVTNKWFGTLTYTDRQGEKTQLCFEQTGITGSPYDGKNKHLMAQQFECELNRIAASSKEPTTEL